MIELFHSMKEKIARHPEALRRFVSYRVEDIRTICELRTFEIYEDGGDGGLVTTPTSTSRLNIVCKEETDSATPEDFEKRLREQRERYGQYLAGGSVPPGWRRYAQDRSLPLTSKVNE